MNTLRKFCFSSLMLLSTSASAIPEFDAIPLSRPNIVAFNLHSEILARTMLVEVALPSSYADDQTTQYPVMYAADGYMTFLMTANDSYNSSLFNNHVPQSITVGFDFSGYDSCGRSQWYTPTQIPDDEECGVIGGGAEQYLSFIRDELKPFINTLFRANQDKEVIAGHSHTATLALFALFTQPELFDMYIAASPSLYWDNEVMFQYQQSFANTHQNLEKPVYISVGLNELGSVFESQEAIDSANEQVFSYVYRLGRKLKQDYPQGNIKFQTFANEDHMSVVGKAFHQGMHYVLTGE